MVSTRRVWAALTLAIALAIAMIAIETGAAEVGAVAPTDTEDCDFDGDGYADLTAGAPMDHGGGISSSGSVHVLYGTATGLAATGAQVWNRSVAGIDGSGWSDARSGGRSPVATSTATDTTTSQRGCRRTGSAARAAPGRCT